jgi:hypothetical protein
MASGRPPIQRYRFRQREDGKIFIEFGMSLAGGASGGDERTRDAALGSLSGCTDTHQRGEAIARPDMPVFEWPLLSGLMLPLLPGAEY